MKFSRLVIIVVTTALLWLGLTASISAQQPPITPTPKPDHEKDLLYEAFSESQRSINPIEQRLAYPAAKAFLQRFGGDNDRYAKEVQRFVDEYERGMRDQEVFRAYSAKHYLKTFELGRPLLKKEPEDFFFWPP